MATDLNTMPNHDPLEPYVDAWWAARAQGRDPSAAELCPDRPELHAALDLVVAALRRGETPPPSRPENATLIGGMVSPPSGGQATVPNPAGSNPLVLPPADDSATWIPQQIGDYRILGVLGRGGMGVVLRAEDARLWRQAAVKVILRELLDVPSARERFLREARAQANIEHDNVAQIYQVGEQDGLPYIAMPLLQGESLRVRLERELIPSLGVTLKVAREVSEGLAAAHARGVVHRDIKPGNIWLEGDPTGLEPTDRFRRCKILDFGLARMTGLNSTVSMNGEMLGTPSYMSPEQVAQEPLDGRSDLFSLGAMLYEMATGKQPFEGSNPFITLANLTTLHPPPARSLNPGCPPALSDLIGQLIAKSPDHRPSSAKEVAEAVRRIEAGYSEAFVPPQLPPRQRPAGPHALGGSSSHPILVEGPPPDAFPDEDEAPSVAPPGLLATPIYVPPPGDRPTEPYPRPNVSGTKVGSKPGSWKDTHEPDVSRPWWVLPGIAGGLVLAGVAGAAFLLWPPTDDDRFTEPTTAREIVSVPTATVLPTRRANDITPPTKKADTPPTKKADTPPTKKTELPPPPPPPPPPPETYKDGMGIALRLVPTGRLSMGFKDATESALADQPAREIEITRPFYIGVHEITRGQFRKFIADSRHITDAEKSDLGGVGRVPGSWFVRDTKFKWNSTGFDQTDDHPVVNVSWDDAVAFCKWASKASGRKYRLPTEAEWEYAARARVEAHPRFFFATAAELPLVANVADDATRLQLEADLPGKTVKSFAGDDGYPFTAPVGTFKPNPFGLYDVIGNVSEWCEDYYGPWDNLPIKDPVQLEPDPEGRRFARGGSHLATSAVRILGRFRYQPGEVSVEVGFRVVVELPPPAKK